MPFGKSSLRDGKGVEERMEKVVFEVAVKSKNVFTDGLQWARNIMGRNLIAYEELIRETISQALERLYTKYPEVYDVQITQVRVAAGAAEIIVYGKVKQ